MGFSAFFLALMKMMLREGRLGDESTLAGRGEEVGRCGNVLGTCVLKMMLRHITLLWTLLHVLMA